MLRQLTILHVSDLHARSTRGVSEERVRQVRVEQATRARVLGEQFVHDLQQLFADRKPHLVCFTGDITDWGLRSEYDEATRCIETLRTTLGLAADSVFVVPGNHDVQRPVEAKAWGEGPS